MLNILFLCTGNSCRSQMAEGFGRSLKDSKYKFFSAGTVKHGLNPLAVKVMSEVGIDISSHESNTLEDFKETHFDIVFTVCSDADQNCPHMPASRVIHVGFDDPPRLTREISDEEAILAVYRRVRDQIKSFVESLDERLY